MTDRIRSEVEALTKSVAEIRTSLDSVWEEVQANREAVLGEVRQVSEIVHSTIANRKKDASRDAAENSDMMEQQQEIVLGLRERVAKLEEGAERLARCDDLSQLEQSWQSQHDEQERRNAQTPQTLGFGLQHSVRRPHSRQHHRRGRVPQWRVRALPREQQAHPAG